MSSTPPPLPFGDPTNIQKEHASAVGKGVLFGCGGCAMALGVVALLGVAVFALVMSFMKGADACQMPLKAAQESELMRAELGEPITMGWLVSGNIQINNGDGTADVTVPVSGPKGSASIHTVGTKKDGGPWSFTKMQATIEASGKQVDLLKP
jgi:hypothetical protein